LADCILDLAATNDFLFGSEYAHAQQVLAAQAALQGAPKAMGKWVKTLDMTGEVTSAYLPNGDADTTKEQRFQFEGKQGDVIWIHADSDCTDRSPPSNPMFLKLYDPTGARLGDVGGCNFGRRELPATGTYTFRASMGYNRNQSARYHIPIHFVRPNHRYPLTYGQTVSGTIDMRAARDIYTFSGQTGDVIKIAGAGCDIDGLILSFNDANGNDMGSVSCRDDTFRLPRTATYQLVINWFDGGPAPYHFVFQGGAFK
jgi:hypothetical protein